MLDVGTVLIVESNDKNRDIAFASTVKHGEIPMSRFSCGEARSLLEERRFKVVFCSDSLSDGEYAEVIRAAKPTPVIVLSRSAEWDSYLAALQAGAFDYIACCPVKVRDPTQGEAARFQSSAPQKRKAIKRGHE